MTSTSAKVLHAIRITPDKTKAPFLVKRTYHFPNNLISATAAIVRVGIVVEQLWDKEENWILSWNHAAELTRDCSAEPV